MNQPPFANPQPPPRDMSQTMSKPIVEQPLPNSSIPATSMDESNNELDALLSNISDTKDLGNEKEITLDLKNINLN